VPGYLARGWSGKWDHLPAAHFTSIMFDLLCLAGSALVGLRFAGHRGAATLAFAWAACPFTQYASNSNTNDAMVPAFLLFGLWLAASDLGRGAFSALSAWTKFATLLVVPLWASYPELRLRRALLYAAGFGAATLAAFSILLLEPNPAHAARVFWDRTLGWQIGRESPFSLWDWRQYHAKGIPDLHLVQRALEALLLLASVAVAFVPRRKSPLQLAAFTAAIILGFELVLTHWFYLYVPWFFPFAALALLVPVATAPQRAEEPEEAHGRELPELVPAG
jgi:hypothetical protein